jgi:hypothetical protein
MNSRLSSYTTATPTIAPLYSLFPLWYVNESHGNIFVSSICVTHSVWRKNDVWLDGFGFKQLNQLLVNANKLAMNPTLPWACYGGSFVTPVFPFSFISVTYYIYIMLWTLMIDSFVILRVFLSSILEHLWVCSWFTRTWFSYCNNSCVSFVKMLTSARGPYN